LDYPTCLQCREEFDSIDFYKIHAKIDCWASIHECKYPEEWTSSLKSYVQKALDPANRKPGWTNTEIIEELKAMI
jgi:hypothetical protein